jgi:hypothetical protein
MSVLSLLLCYICACFYDPSVGHYTWISFPARNSLAIKHMIEITIQTRSGMMMMMMIVHQLRHERQDNHATNHARCAKSSEAGLSGRHSKTKQSETM